MGILYGNAIVGQSGGPTAAINATLAGVIRGAMEAHHNGIIDVLYGMRNGVEGLLIGDLIDLSHFFDESKLQALESTPAAALGSCRKKLGNMADDADSYGKIFDMFKKCDIRYFFYIGGNDSMDTVSKLSEYSHMFGHEMRFIGIPKTIDNDLVCTDHTPGFGSAAKYVATTVKEMLRDISVYTTRAVTIVEIMGRDAGWLTASAALPKISGGASPDLIYLPERPFDINRFVKDVEDKLNDHPAVMVAVSEGIRLANGEYVGATGGAVDVFGHKYLSGAGKVLENIVKEKIGCKVRSVELNLPQRCASHIASYTDIIESVRIGIDAVKKAIGGENGVMMVFERERSKEYSVSIKTEQISKIANKIKNVPNEFINKDGNNVTDKCIEYLSPLIIGELYTQFENGLPKHIII